MTTATKPDRKKIDAKKASKRAHFVVLLNRLAQTADDLIEEYGELRPTVLASLRKAERDIKRGNYREITNLTKL
jgi:hypothetical protein